jgi:ubiquinone/menaquinone biosynthesis C-methylase UbiE
MTTWQRLSAVLYDPFFWLAERAGLAARRRALVQQARGRVLEIGAGTGLNLRHYADDADLVLSEPDAAMADRLRRRVAGRQRPATVVLAPAEALPFADGEFDTVVSTLVLCTVPDQAAALREIRRVLRPGGRLLFMEHIRSESPRWARWQDRLNTPWRAFAEGCT